MCIFLFIVVSVYAAMRLTDFVADREKYDMIKKKIREVIKKLTRRDE